MMLQPAEHATFVVPTLNIKQDMIQLLTALLLGLLMILDPCTLFTSIAAIGYIDKEITNRQKVLLNGLMFVFGKLATYTLLAIPFIMGAKTDGIKHFLQDWGGDEGY